MAHRQRDRGRCAPVDQGTAELIADRDRPRAYTLLVDGAPQSHVDLADPTHLEFEYVRRMATAVDLVAAPGVALRVLHLGGGALTLPRYIAATRPSSTQRVVEIDGALVELVRRELPWDRQARLKVRVADAREALDTSREHAYDLVVTDVFAGSRTPAHLTTVEFVAQAARVLRPGGWYLANVADGGALHYSRAQAATIRAALPQGCVVADAAVLHGRRFGNLVMLAGTTAPPLAELARRAAGDWFPGRVEPLARFAAGASPVGDGTAVASPAPPAGLF